MEPGRFYILELGPNPQVSWGVYPVTEEVQDLRVVLAQAVTDGWDRTMADLHCPPTRIPLGINVAKKWARALVDPASTGREWNHYGTTPARGEAARALALTIDPPSFPYQAANVTNGVARPEQWTNGWVSDPGQSMPQWLELTFAEPQVISRIHVTFDTNLSHLPEYPFYVSPECVRDYDISAYTNGSWKPVVEILGNYQRHRVHRFDPLSVQRLRLTVAATNGAAEVKVFEVRCYRH